MRAILCSRRYRHRDYSHGRLSRARVPPIATQNRRPPSSSRFYLLLLFPIKRMGGMRLRDNNNVSDVPTWVRLRPPTRSEPFQKGHARVALFVLVLPHHRPVSKDFHRVWSFKCSPAARAEGVHNLVLFTKRTKNSNKSINVPGMHNLKWYLFKTL